MKKSIVVAGILILILVCIISVASAEVTIDYATQNGFIAVVD